MAKAGDSGSGKPIDVLMFEDDPGDVLLARELMEESKLTIQMTVAEDGVQGMQMLRGEGQYADALRPDLILLDLNMPRMDGLAVLNELKNDPVLRVIPVVVLTTSSSDRDVMEAYSRHANCYITKPLDLDQFAKIVSVIDEFWFTVVKLPRLEPNT